MNWEAIGVIAEIVGAIAVVVTLIYLAIQVRQAKHEISAVGMQARASHARGALEDIVNSSELIDVFIKLDFLNYGDYGLSKKEMIRFGAWCHTWMQTEQGSFYLLPEGAHDELRTWWLSTPAGSEFWENNKGFYDDAFVEYMDSLKEKLDAEGRSSMEIQSGTG